MEFGVSVRVTHNHGESAVEVGLRGGETPGHGETAVVRGLGLARRDDVSTPVCHLHRLGAGVDVRPRDYEASQPGDVERRHWLREGELQSDEERHTNL